MKYVHEVNSYRLQKVPKTDVFFFFFNVIEVYFDVRAYCIFIVKHTWFGCGFSNLKKNKSSVFVKSNILIHISVIWYVNNADIKILCKWKQDLSDKI